MSSSSYFGISSTKSRRSSPGEPQGVLFQTGQGGRTVLPPISSAFPTSRFPGPAYSNPYNTPRSSPARYEVNTQALYNHWPSNISADTTPSFNYETHDRYSTQPLYNFPARTSPVPSHNSENRKLPPLNTTSPSWQSYPIPSSSNYQSGASMVRSPTASYPAEYPIPAYGPSYTYLPTRDHENVQIPTMSPPVVPPFEGTDYSRTEHHRSPSPYGRNTSQVIPRSPTPPPVSPTSGPEETTIKKKRKRADANQLKVLNETYNRTAFPSTEERLALAKLLDMSPRSVQIWFQNKRQSMRQTNRQSSTVGTASQPLVLTNQDMLEDAGHLNYPIALPEAPFPAKHSSDAPLTRSHTSHPSSSHRRQRHHEDSDHRKWPAAY